jgi:hypothetical protein
MKSPDEQIATAVTKSMTVQQVVEYQGVGYLYTGINPDAPYASFKRLPAAVTYLGRTFGKSCYDSDRNVAIYRTDVSVARAAR